ncbi:MAG: hypothetical protein HOV68_22545, partial [Streptomycetaceae bacterium]|nr:hypothetical protein [Streptomycetaceae bacterium]
MADPSAPESDRESDRESTGGAATAKTRLRARLLAARTRTDASERAHAAHALGEALAALPELAAAHTVAAYVPVGS